MQAFAQQPGAPGGGASGSLGGILMILAIVALSVWLIRGRRKGTKTAAAGSGGGTSGSGGSLIVYGILLMCVGVGGYFGGVLYERDCRKNIFELSWGASQGRMGMDHYRSELVKSKVIQVGSGIVGVVGLGLLIYGATKKASSSALAAQASRNTPAASGGTPGSARYCSSCGQKLDPGSKFCTQCGSQIG